MTKSLLIGFLGTLTSAMPSWSDEPTREQVLGAEAIAYWVYHNCPDIKLGPATLMMAGTVGRHIPEAELTAERDRLAKVIAARSVSVAATCQELAPRVID
jgi:hypothetical protein